MQDDVAADVTKRADVNSRTDLRAGFDDSTRMDQGAIPAGCRNGVFIELGRTVRGHVFLTNSNIIADHVSRRLLNGP
ncbi:MAG: hypothetical protein ACRYG8_02095 [Janthinobacterium lividum]